MKIKDILAGILLVSGLIAYAGEMRYVGGDISLYPEYVQAGAKYQDQDGNPIDLLPYLNSIGMNAMRVRLFVDPAAFKAAHPSDYDPNACQSLPYVIPLCRDIIENGFELMLDFHYSDTWADPGAQWIPEGWQGLSDTQLEQKVYEYTKETLVTLRQNGIVPKFIQPGNEISYGMLWGPFGSKDDSTHVWPGSSDASWQRFGNFLNSAIKACREECPDSEIIIHTERVEEVNVLTNFYDMMKKLNIDYDIIGLSYYPYFHGTMSVLNKALDSLEKRYTDKDIMIVETGFPYEWEVPGTDHKVDYKYSETGQNDFAKDLVNTLLSHPKVTGLFWWWLEYNAKGTSLTGWYNAPLFNSNTGMATPALKTIASFGDSSASVGNYYEDNSDKDENWYDLNGRVYKDPTSPGFYIHKKQKVIIK